MGKAKKVSKARARYIFEALVAHIEGQVDGFEVRYKREHVSQRLIGALIWIFNRHYMARFVTTIGPKVYFPSREFVAGDPWQAAKILAHEYVHIRDWRRTLFFKLRYLGPQSYIAIAMCFGTAAGAVLGAPWFAHLGWLLALVPWPAPFRRDAELRGYAMNMLVNMWRYGSVRTGTIEWIAKKFTGPDYFFMWPFRKNVQERITEIEGAITFRTIFQGEAGEPYTEVFELLEFEYSKAA